MILRIGIAMEVDGRPDEYEKVERFRHQIEELALEEGFPDVTLDDSLANDFFRVLKELGELRRRAIARSVRK